MRGLGCGRGGGLLEGEEHLVGGRGWGALAFRPQERGAPRVGDVLRERILVRRLEVAVGGLLPSNLGQAVGRCVADAAQASGERRVSDLDSGVGVEQRELTVALARVALRQGPCEVALVARDRRERHVGDALA